MAQCYDMISCDLWFMFILLEQFCHHCTAVAQPGKNFYQGKIYTLMRGPDSTDSTLSSMGGTAFIGLDGRN